MTDSSRTMDMPDGEIKSCFAARNYAEEHLDEITDRAYQSCVRKAYTTRASHLGTACPSLIGQKRGAS